MALHTEIDEQSELNIVKQTLPSDASHLLSHDPAETMIGPNQSGMYQLLVSEKSSKPQTQMSTEKRTVILRKKSICEKEKKEVAPIQLIGGSQRNIISNVSKPLILEDKDQPNFMMEEIVSHRTGSQISITQQSSEVAVPRDITVARFKASNRVSGELNVKDEDIILDQK